MSGAMQMLLATKSTSASIADGKTWSANRVGAAALYQLNTDGSYTKILTGTASNWYEPVTAGIGSSYWVQADITSGDALTFGTTGSRLALSSNQKWESSLDGSTVLSIKFYDAASGGSLLGTNTLTLTGTPA